MIVNCCPSCGGKIVISVLTQTSHEHYVGKTGKVLKEHKQNKNMPLNVVLAACEDCGYQIDPDDFWIDENGMFNTDWED